MATKPELPLTAVKMKLTVTGEGNLLQKQWPYKYTSTNSRTSLIKSDHCYVPPGIKLQWGRSRIIGKGFVSSSVG
jgi:hypothetical protein